MCSRSTISLLLSWQLPAILAQQACYWPDGKPTTSGQAELINCYSSQAGICCNQGDMCMSNGLCISGNTGQAYRGGCTDKNWSNTTTCPDWCNDRYSNNTANIFNCPGKPWYYCEPNLSTLCQTSGTQIQSYTSARILGTPPITSTGHIPTANSRILTTSITVTESTASSTLTCPPRSTQIIHQSTLPATAIGAGLGVPFGIAAIGFLFFLFWKDARRKNARGPKHDTSQDKRTTRHNTLTGGEMDGNGLRPELQGGIMAPELPGNEMVQQPNGIAPR